MTLCLSKLMAVADKATDGPWRTHLVDSTQVVSGQFDIASACSDIDAYDTDYERIEANASHIATFDPPTVKRLLAIAKAAKDWEYTMYTDGNSSFDEIKAVCKALRASLEGVEL